MLVAILFFIIPILLVVITFIFGFSWYIAYASLRPLKIPNRQTPADIGMPFEAFSLENDGLALTGWFVPAAPDKSRQKKAATIILSHGWSGNAETMLPHCKYLHDAGFHVVLYNLRGHGDSDAVNLTSLNRMRQDLTKILDYTISRKEVDAGAVGLLGHSIGASASILVAAADKRIKAIVSSSSFADFDYLAEQALRMRGLPRFPFDYLVKIFWEKIVGVELKSISPLGRIREVSAAILLVHGEADRIISKNELDKLVQCAPDVEKELIKGRGHSDLDQDEAYFARISSFLNQRFQTSVR